LSTVFDAVISMAYRPSVTVERVPKSSPETSAVVMLKDIRLSPTCLSVMTSRLLSSREAVTSLSNMASMPSRRSPTVRVVSIA